MIELIDTHTHLYLEQFDEDLDDLLAVASQQGINQFLLPNIDSTSIERVKQLSNRLPGKMIPMMGLHPCSVKENVEEELAIIYQELKKGGYIAVGEIGVDLYWDKSFLKQQQDAFITQCNWAKEMQLPIAIHVRDAFDELFELMDSVYDDSLSGVFHCFSGNQEQAEKCLGYSNFYLGIGGVVTFKNGGIDKFLNDVPLERILVETDAPYLAPAPNRGKRNIPEYVTLVAEKLATVYQKGLDEIAATTTQNAKQLFKLT